MKTQFRFPKINYKTFSIVIIVLTILVSLAGCNDKKGIKTGEMPPEISGNDIHGEYLSLKQLKGKVVVVYFWTNSCCGDKLKLLEPYYVQNKDKGLAILAINVADTNEIVESYAKNNGVTFTLQTDEHSMTSRDYGVFGFPTIFIIDRDGILRKKIMGYIEVSQLEKLVVQYLMK